MKIREMMQRKEGQKGFTLVELIVVMAILAVLAAIAVPRMGGVLEDAKYKAHNSNIEMIGEAARVWLSMQEAGAANGTISDLTNDGYLKDTDVDHLPYSNTSGSAYTCDINIDASTATIKPGKATGRDSNGDWQVETNEVVNL